MNTLWALQSSFLKYDFAISCFRKPQMNHFGDEKLVDLMKKHLIWCYNKLKGFQLYNNYSEINFKWVWKHATGFISDLDWIPDASTVWKYHISIHSKDIDRATSNQTHALKVYFTITADRSGSRLLVAREKLAETLKGGILPDQVKWKTKVNPSNFIM